jgi:fumarate hydratase subunit alpha
MKEIDASLITETVSNLCIQANTDLCFDIVQAINDAYEAETWEPARETLLNIKENIKIAKEKELPICQDTGMVSVYIIMGPDVHINGDLVKAVNDGVSDGYTRGFLRKSMVRDPLRRVNTEDNTPAFITIEPAQGDYFKIIVSPKGCGSENKCKLKFLNPTDGEDEIVRFVVDTVKEAGAAPCPPIVIGVGIGGNFEKVAYLSKKALLRPLFKHNSDPYYANLEKRVMEEVNKLGIGPQGFGGRTTCLGVAIETLPTHVAGLPVAVNISCHVTRRKCAEL